jgi:DNA-binding NarL/FixJ family response regulator
VCDKLSEMRVFHCDDSDAYRRLLELSLAGREGIDVVGGAGDRASVLEGIGDTQPDVVLLDAIAPDFGTDLVHEILETAPAARVVVLSGLTGARADDDRISAHVTKDVSFDELEAILHRVNAAR